MQSGKYKELQSELNELRRQLSEANETIEAIRTGQVDALVVEGKEGHQLYTLQSADHTYRVFIEKMNEGAVTLDTGGAIMYCNSSFAQMTGLQISNVIGLPFVQFLTDASVPIFETLFANCWAQDCKAEMQLKSEPHPIPVHLSLTALEVADHVSLSMILTDLTSIKEAEKELKRNYLEIAATNHALEASNHDLQQFASVASHDLQEPLRKIEMFSELLTDRLGDQLPADALKYLSKIRVSASRMKTLILDVLNYSKLSANNNFFQKLDLNLLVQELLEDLELVAAEKRAHITVDVMPVIEANPGQIRQVFQNIVSNAIKFSRKDSAPTVHISCKRIAEKSFLAVPDDNGEYCLISVEDNGIGFDSKFVNNIFVLFERLHSKDIYEGTGIGLAISKKIIEKHNGLITAESVAGQGSKFSFVLPVVQDKAVM